MNIPTSKSLRSVLATLRNGQTFDAATLVQNTLAQHGLVSGPAPTFVGPLTRAPKAAGAMRNARASYGCAAGMRDYVLELPALVEGPPRGLIVMLHGCTQTPEDFARGTGMTAQAHAAGLAVVYVAQSRGDNAQSCWNWFSGADQKRGKGEPAILAGLALDTARTHSIPERAIFVAGLSAGAAMAVILGRTYPEIFAGVGAHSGLPYGSANGVAEAFAAMGGNPARAPRSVAVKPTPTIVFHGMDDNTVQPSNGAQIVRDTLIATGPITQNESAGKIGGRGYRCTTNLSGAGHILSEHWEIDGLGHAWSGGNPAGSYADKAGPDASAQMIRFFADLAE